MASMGFLGLHSYRFYLSVCTLYVGAELRNICSSCPELQILDIRGVVNPGEWPGLLQLPPSCTELCIGGPAMSDAAATVVRQLTHLRVFRWWNSPGLTDVGVEQLTALTRLTTLDIHRCEGLSRELWRHHPIFNYCVELWGGGRNVSVLCGCGDCA
jgi:hypothetical protein